MRPERAAQIMAEIGAVLLTLLLILRGLSVADTVAAPVIPEPPMEVQPYLGNYIFSESGQSVSFRLDPKIPATSGEEAVEAAWYTARLSDGLPYQTEEPKAADIRPFLLRSQKLFLLVGAGDSLATGSPSDTLVGVTSLSPDRKMMAFSAARQTGPLGLYIKETDGQLHWLGHEESISGLAWSPDNRNLAYIAPRDGVPQLLIIDREGQNLVQVTNDPAPKASPVWLLDGQSLAYVAVSAVEGSSPAETEEKGSIFIKEPGAQTPEMVVDNIPPDTRLEIVPVDGQIAYFTPIPDHPRMKALNLFYPVAKTSRRVYPPLTVEALECPPTLTRNKPVTIKLQLANTSLQPTSLPLIVRTAAEPLPLTGDRTVSAVRIESIDLRPGETRQIEWQVQPSAGLDTHISVLVDLVELYPMSEMHCQIRNTYLGLPNLRYLPAVLPLLIPGLLLHIPWLRHKKKAWLWALIPIYLTILIGLIAVETQMVSLQPF